MSDIGEPFYVDATVIQQETDLKSAPRRKLSDEDHVICCEDLKGKFVSRNHIFQKGTSRKLKAYAEARRKEISQRGGLKPSVYSFAMDTHGSFCDTSILFLKKLAVVKFSNEPGSEPLIAWKRANWVQETCLLIQSTVLRAASLYFHRGLRKCFADDYELLFDSPVSRRLDNTVLGHSPPHIPAAG